MIYAVSFANIVFELAAFLLAESVLLHVHAKCVLPVKTNAVDVS
jgi:hypothetical protein